MQKIVPIGPAVLETLNFEKRSNLIGWELSRFRPKFCDFCKKIIFLGKIRIFSIFSDFFTFLVLSVDFWEIFLNFAKKSIFLDFGQNFALFAKKLFFLASYIFFRFFLIFSDFLWFPVIFRIFFLIFGHFGPFFPKMCRMWVFVKNRSPSLFSLRRHLLPCKKSSQSVKRFLRY